jgi:hypothetical protein
MIKILTIFYINIKDKIIREKLFISIYISTKSNLKNNLNLQFILIYFYLENASIFHVY